MPSGDRRRIVGELDQFGAADAKVGEHRIGEDLAELVGAGRVAALGREGLDIDIERSASRSRIPTVTGRWLRSRWLR